MPLLVLGSTSEPESPSVVRSTTSSCVSINTLEYHLILHLYLVVFRSTT